MYAYVIPGFQCITWHVMSFVGLVVERIFLRSKPGRGEQRQVSVMYRLLICGILGVEFHDIYRYMIIRI
jgi:hypothetical protein